MKIPYFLAEACQNTFVLFDLIKRSQILGEGDSSKVFWKHAHAILLKEKRDDALILTLEKETSTALYVRMQVLGVDGKFGEFCGNGSRSVAAHLFSCYPSFKVFYIVTKRGVYPLRSLGKGIFATHLPPVQFSESKIRSIPYGEILEPHLALQKSLSDHDLYKLGLHLNQKQTLFPDGINVNAWTVLNKNTISVKTFERGVGGLTKSCGTGSSVCAALYLQGKGKVFVKTPGGFLCIRMQQNHLELIGRAQCSTLPKYYEV